MSRTSDARERLLTAGLDLLWETGYASTSVDEICLRAGVKKGSFYHFFQSKSELAVAAMDKGWAEKRPAFDDAFSPMVPPLERLRRCAALVQEKQVELLAKAGFVCGCPLFCLGSEVCNQDELIRSKIEEILSHHLCYYESAIRDAQRAGHLPCGDALERANRLHRYTQGALTEARILNSLSPIKDLVAGWFAILGIREEAPAA